MALLDGGEDGLLVGPQEGQAAGGHGVEAHAEAPDVGGLAAVGLSAGDLRSEVMDGAAEGGEERDALGSAGGEAGLVVVGVLGEGVEGQRGEAGEAKVRELDRACGLVEKEVLQLHVSVAEACLVDAEKGVDHLGEELLDLFEVFFLEEEGGGGRDGG